MVDAFRGLDPLLIATKLGQSQLLAVADDRAQTPRKCLERAKNDVGLLQCEHELVEDLARLCRGRSLKRRNIVALHHQHVGSVVDSLQLRVDELAVAVLALDDGEYHRLVGKKDLGQRHGRLLL